MQRYPPNFGQLDLATLELEGQLPDLRRIDLLPHHFQPLLHAGVDLLLDSGPEVLRVRLFIGDFILFFALQSAENLLQPPYLDQVTLDLFVNLLAVESFKFVPTVVQLLFGSALRFIFPLQLQFH